MSEIETPAPKDLSQVDLSPLEPSQPLATSLTSTSVKPDPMPDADWSPRITGTRTPDALHAANANSSEQCIQTRRILIKQLGFKPEQVSDDDAEVVLWACRTVATRAARLSACAVAAVLEQTKKVGQEVDVGVDGRCVKYLYRPYAIVTSVV